MKGNSECLKIVKKNVGFYVHKVYTYNMNIKLIKWEVLIIYFFVNC
jgi:hypothetical protein